MRRRRRFTLTATFAAATTAATGLVSGAALLGPGGATAAAAPAHPDRASQAHPGYVKRSLTFTVTGIPDETTGQGTQSCTIAADLYKPPSAGAGHRVPVILTTNGFGGSKNDQAGLGKVGARHGYGVLSYSGLGFGGSSCRISLDDRQHDGKAGSQLVSWLGGDAKVKAVGTDGKRVQPPNWIIHDRRDHAGHHDRYDPRLGMIGGSYGGQIQFAIAGRDPRVDAIIPIITWNSLAYSLAPNNLASHGGFKRGVTYNEAAAPGTEKFDWTSLFFGVGIEDGLQGATVDPSRDAGCANFVQQACTSKAELDSQGYPDTTTFAFAQKASVASYLHRIRIPTLLVQGEADTLFDLQEAVATYRGLRHQHTPVSMIWQSWGHSDGTAAPGEYKDGPGVLSTYEGHRFFHWFGRYLKHQPVKTGPRFAYYRDWVPFHGKGPDTRQYGHAARYPVGGGRRLFLSGSNRLVRARSSVKAGSAQYSNPGGGSPSSYSETSALQGGNIPNQSSPPTDAPGTFASWASAKLVHHLDVVGIPTTRVRLSCPACSTATPGDQLQVFAKIYDVAPDGSIDLVHRLISPVRAASLAKPVKIQLPGIVHRFKRGHRVELVLAATDAAYRNNDPTQPVTVTTSPKHPGWLRLPVVTHRRGRGH